jgi:DNA-binding NtrC family response regulator
MTSVVCVEDDPDVLLLLQLTAARAVDFEVVGTASETDNLRELLDESHPDVVVLDHDLDARRWGLELVEAVRMQAPTIIIALFTARHGLATAARNAGVDVLVEKPHVDELWAMVRRACEAQSVIDVRDNATRPFFVSEAVANPL